MIKKNFKIELLAPAKDLKTAKSAILSGADAVYTGFLKFGARKQAGNSLADIKELVEFADLYRVKIYVTLNTIYTDEELPEVVKTVYDLYEIGVSGIIIQDMALLNTELPPVPIFASTQCHNNTLEKIKFLEEAGVKRVILPREFSLSEIKNITENADIEVETFVHGALCVSYSGQCYLSYAIGGRSANRGECAQPCRKKYSLVDSSGKIIAKDKYLLSLKDLNLSEYIKDLVEAGVTSFKIEGRLKDEAYVKNVVSYYRRKIDEVLSDLKLEKSSIGRSYNDFEPNLSKSFNRGFTDFYTDGKRKNICTFDYSKSTGEFVGTVKKVSKDYFILDNDVLNNSDGICFLTGEKELCGTLVKIAEGNKIIPNSMEKIKIGTRIYRNFDKKFNQVLENQISKRKIDVCADLKIYPDKILLKLSGEDNVCIEYLEECMSEKALNTEKMSDTIKKQLLKTGETEFNIIELNYNTSDYFVPVSVLNSIRRNALEKLKKEYINTVKHDTSARIRKYPKFPYKNLDYSYNILNLTSEDFYKKCGAEVCERAAEFGTSLSQKNIMTSKHCIKYTLKLCPKYFDNKNDYKEPFYLLDEKNEKYKLKFNCKNCFMSIEKL